MPIDRDIRNMSFLLAVLCGFLSIYRLYLLSRSFDISDDEAANYTLRQLVYTYTWVMVANFFYSIYREQVQHDIKNKRIMKKTMEYITLAALVGSIGNTVVLIGYYYQIVGELSGNVIVHNVAEALIWLLLSMFLAAFFFWHRGVRRELNRLESKRYQQQNTSN